MRLTTFSLEGSNGKSWNDSEVVGLVPGKVSTRSLEIRTFSDMQDTPTGLRGVRNSGSSLKAAQIAGVATVTAQKDINQSREMCSQSPQDMGDVTDLLHGRDHENSNYLSRCN